MVSFLEKLKKGMGIEIPKEPEKEKLEEKPLKESPKGEQVPYEAGKLPTGQAKPALKKKRMRKIKIEAQLVEPEIKKVEEKKEIETKEEEEKIEVKKEAWFEPEGQLAIDVYKTEENLVIQSAIAGVRPENLDISIESDVVTIKGERENPAAEKERKYFHQECYWGPFSREIILPEETDPSRAEASMKEGILIIRIPKIERKKKRKIEVKG